MSALSNELLSTDQAAAFLGLKPNTLEIWRVRGQGPRFLKLGTKVRSRVRYRRSELEAWLGSELASTSAFSAQAGKAA